MNCSHCKETIEIQQGDELLTELMDSLFICPKCGFPTTNIIRGNGK